MLKSFIQKFLLAVVLTVSLFSPICAVDDFQVECQPQIIERVVQFQQRGILKQKDNGYLYLEVSGGFIAEVLLASFEAPGKIVPPATIQVKKVSAHTSA